MLKKAKAELNAQAAQASDSSKSMAQSVLDSSHQIWLAGLGAFAKAQQGGMQVFDALVKQGRGVEAKTRDVAAQTAQAARGAATAKAKEMQAMAEGTWDKLEQVFENRVACTARRLYLIRCPEAHRPGRRTGRRSQHAAQGPGDPA
jgi:poly(hydroxyalkanoate) granule-associated protein